MARSALTIQELAPETASADLAVLEATDADNGDIVEAENLDGIVIQAFNSGASAATVTVVQAPSLDDGLGGGPGDLVVTLAAGESKFLAGLSSARFEQPAGTETGEAAGLYLDSGDTGAADVEYLVLRDAVPN